MTGENPFVLGVDLDGVCADYTKAFRAYAAAVLGRDESSMGEQRSWRIEECNWGIVDRAHFLELHRSAVIEQRMFATMPEIEGASDALWNLSDKGVHIRIITHRLVFNWEHDITVSDTVHWMQQKRGDGRPRIPYRDVCFCSNKNDVGADLYIDDAPHNITNLRIERNEVICFDAPYNQEVPGLRAKNWDEIVRIVEERLART
jgi:5'(3')-deoxyribonucleotidase